MDKQDVGDDIVVDEAIYKKAEAFNALVGGEGYLYARWMVKAFKQARKQSMWKRWVEIDGYLQHRAGVKRPYRVVLIVKSKR